MARPRKWDPVTKMCAVCDGVFIARTAYQIQQQRCCGSACANKLAWATSRKVDKVRKRCRSCKAFFEVDPSRARVRFTCSLECRGKWQTENGTSSGENNGAWEGGSSKWWKRRARERDDFTCQVDGCDVRDEGKRTHAHHKLPLAAGGVDALDNLITLCSEHHRMLEHQLFVLFLERYPKEAAILVHELYAPG